MVATTVMAALEEDSVYTITPSFAGTPYKRSTAPWRTASLPTLEVPTEDTRKDPRRPSTTKDMTSLITDPRTPLATEDTKKDQRGTPATEDTKKGQRNILTPEAVKMNRSPQQEDLDQELYHSMKNTQPNPPPRRHHKFPRLQPQSPMKIQHRSTTSFYK